MSIKSNLLSIREALPARCRLIAVSKTQPVEKITEAYEVPHRIFGENKVQELVPKAEALPKDIEWHMIGHLQTNKVKYIAPFVTLIHGVDSPKLLAEINKQGKKIDRVIPCLLQVHIAREETKFGFSSEELIDFLASQSFHELGHVSIRGLMGMATFTDNTSQVREEFRSLKDLFDKIRSLPRITQIQCEELSMGMSGDYKIAIDEGSTMVRIGTAIFGERNYQ
jgi:PLP dependent protein